MSHITKQLRELKAKPKPPPGHDLPAIDCNRFDMRLLPDGRWRVSFGHEIDNCGVVAWHGAITIGMSASILMGKNFITTAQAIQKQQQEAAAGDKSGANAPAAD